MMNCRMCVMLVVLVQLSVYLLARAEVGTASAEVSGTSEHTPYFKANYFAHNVGNWAHFFQSAGFDTSKPYHFLEVGSLEGQSALWMLQHVLLHPASTITCIDTWLGGPEYDADLTNGLYERFLHNIEPYRHKVNIVRGRSSDALKHPSVTAAKFDFVYIDGAHRARNALEDAILAFPLLKIGGFMLFDDYFSNLDAAQSIESPKAGIDAFLNVYANAYRIVGFSYQLNIMKVTE